MVAGEDSTAGRLGAAELMGSVFDVDMDYHKPLIVWV